MEMRMITSGLVGAAAIALAITALPSAAADDGVTAVDTTIGQQARLTDGTIVQGWTITGLKPSTDTIPYTPRGTLWEATATNEAIQGSVQPVVSNLNARAADGENYRVLFGIATSEGVNPASLTQGEKTSGKVYFDVTGANPDRVVYNAGGTDLAIWAPAPPAPAAAGSAPQWTPSTGSGQHAPAQTAPAPAATTPAPAATGSSGTPITEGTPAAPAATGSQGTPLPAGTPTTTAPEAGSTGTPVSEGTPVSPAPAAATPAPAPAGTSTGTPLTEGTPATTAPAAAPAAAGSAGTPMTEGITAPTTTVVPHGGATPAS